MTANTDETRYTAGAKDAGLTEADMQEMLANVLAWRKAGSDTIIIPAWKAEEILTRLLSAQAEVKQAEDAKETITFSSTEISMLLLALTASGLISNGGHPSAQSMEILVSKRREFMELTKKVDAAIQAQGAKQT